MKNVWKIRKCSKIEMSECDSMNKKNDVDDENETETWTEEEEEKRKKNNKPWNRSRVRERNVNRMYVYDSGFKLGGIKLFKSNIKISLHFLSWYSVEHLECLLGKRCTTEFMCNSVDAGWIWCCEFGALMQWNALKEWNRQTDRQANEEENMCVSMCERKK